MDGGGRGYSDLPATGARTIFWSLKFRQAGKTHMSFIGVDYQ